MFFRRIYGRCTLTATPINLKYVTGSELGIVTSHLRSETTYYIAGSNSAYVPSTKTKYVDKSVCKQWPDLEGQSRLMTPGEAARTEMMREWPLLDRVGWFKGHAKLFDKRPPLHYAGPRVGHMVYVDLDSAYHQLYSNMWLDQLWPRGYYGRYPLSEPANRLKGWKGARNSLVGICRARSGAAYKGNKRITLRFKNRFLSPCLWATVQDLLHVVASKAVELGAIYINTDGYLFYTDPPEFYETFVTWLSENGFRWSVRATGNSEVVSWNNYRVGSTCTKANELSLIQSSKEFTNVNFENRAKWLKWWENARTISASENRNGLKQPPGQGDIHQADAGNAVVQQGC